MLQEATWSMRPNIVEMSRTAPLPYLLITVQAIVLQKVSLSDMQNLSKSIFKKKMTLIAEVWESYQITDSKKHGYINV